MIGLRCLHGFCLSLRRSARLSVTLLRSIDSQSRYLPWWFLLPSQSCRRVLFQKLELQVKSCQSAYEDLQTQSNEDTARLELSVNQYVADNVSLRDEVYLS